MEQRPFGELYVSASVNSVGVVVHDLFEGVVKERLEVHDWDFHDYVQGNEVNDTDFDTLLERQDADVNVFTVQRHCAL